MTNFPRRSKRPGMVPLGPNPASSVEALVDRLGEPNAEALHAARKRRRRFGLHEKVHMVRLNAEVYDSKRGEGRARKATSNFHEDSPCAQRGKPSHHPHGDMDWVAAVVDRPLPMRNAAPRSSRLASGTCSASTPIAESELTLPAPTHLDWADIIESQ